VEAINDTFQIYGGSAYFTDLPLERMLRDARINQIGEGSNEVLTSLLLWSECVVREWSLRKFTNDVETFGWPNR